MSAIKFLIMSGCYEEAFKLASDHNQIELYGDLLVDEVSDGDVQREFLALASHFESKKNLLLAGKYYYHGKQYRKVSCSTPFESVDVNLLLETGIEIVFSFLSGCETFASSC